MRKKIIGFLYSKPYFSWIIPLFHFFIGHSKIKNKSHNIFSPTNSNIYNDRIYFKGINNCVSIGESTDLTNSYITIKGNNNRVIIGKAAFINGINIIIEGNDCSVIIGDCAFVLDNTRVWVVDGSSLQIGVGCMFSDNIDIRTTDNHSIIDIEINKRINPEENIIIGDNVWIGTGVTVLKGVEIPEWCIVGAKSVITRKHKIPHAIIVGNPGKEVKNNVKWTMERNSNY